MKKAVLVIPTYNEIKNIDNLFAHIADVAKKVKGWNIEVLIVDSASPDGTSALVQKNKKKYPFVHLLTTQKRGLGRAYSEGFDYAIRNLDPYVLFEMDADLSHDPLKIPEFLTQIEKGSDFVVGSRYMRGGSIPSDWGFHRKIFSVLGNLIIRFGFMRLSINDWTSGYRAIKVWIIQDAREEIRKYSGYVFQVALLDAAVKKNARITTVPINFIDRKHGISKINSLQYTINTLLYVFTHSSFIAFVMVGGCGFLIDSTLLYTLYHYGHYSIKFSKIISSEVAILSNFTLNNFWSFSHKKLDHKFATYAKQFAKFNLIALPSIAIQTIGIVLLTTFFGKHFFYPLFYNMIVILFLVIPYSYILYNKVIWRNK